uniref:Uncharacterized protein n=1 Tax=Staphylothermus marinus TaxID=2280 RepID=A0A7C4HCY6_STAMA
MKIKKERFANLIEYGYFTDKTISLLLIIVSLTLVIIIAAWPTTIIDYLENPSIAGQYSLGVSILTTTLILLSSIVAFLIPYFTPLFKTRSFREIRDTRTKNLYLFSTAALLSTAIIVYLLAALTTI